MGYLSIPNLYKNPKFLETAGSPVYALEKVHGSSANVRWDGHNVFLSSGGESPVVFAKLFDQEKLATTFRSLVGEKPVTVFGEVYGGKCQKMSDTYGKDMAFIVFDVFIDNSWMIVPDAEDFATKLGLEFVPYETVDCTLAALDAQRDRPSLVAERRGTGTDKKREGIIIRPLVEVYNHDLGERVICKHKGAAFSETATPREVDPSKIKVLDDANAIAEEWVVEGRLRNVLSHLPHDTGIKDTGVVIRAMVDDIKKEAVGEIVWTKEAEREISKRAASLFKTFITKTCVD